MALLHRADLRPSKIDLITAWLPGRRWYRGSTTPTVRRVASCRLDDPAGAVGMETIIVDTGDGALLHVPLTYRDAPLEGDEEWLLGTAEHSVLGRRWVYDACGDPRYLAVLARTILTGGSQSPEYVAEGDRVVPREPDMTLHGAGSPTADVPEFGAPDRVDDADPTLIVAGRFDLVVVRALGTAAGPTTADGGGWLALTATWPGLTTPLPLAYARLH